MFNNINLRRIALGFGAAAIIAAAIAIFALQRSTQVSAALQAPQISGNFELSTPDGRIVTNESYRGKWLLIYFGYTFCPDVCPTTLMSMAQALQKLGPAADKVQPIFITVDPERDTPQHIGEYVKDFDSRFVGLAGSREQVAAAARAFHVYYSVRQLGNNEYVIDHSSFIYVINPKGEFVRLLTGDLPEHELADQLMKLMT